MNLEFRKSSTVQGDIGDEFDPDDELYIGLTDDDGEGACDYLTRPGVEALHSHLGALLGRPAVKPQTLTIPAEIVVSLKLSGGQE